MKELFYTLNPWWEDEFKINSIRRDKYLSKIETNLDNKDIIIITGLRRIGKTTIMKQIIADLLQKTAKENIFYISLDLIQLSQLSIQEIIKEYKKIQKIENKTKTYVFLDEITSKENYNQELKNIYDTSNTKIFASASSASLLKDSKAQLTGRARYFEIEALDFQEFLKFNNYETKLSEKHLTEKYFEEYMEIGGIPEFVLTKDISYINELIHNIIYKDIISKHKIKNEQFVFDLFRLLCERSGKTISYNKLSNILGISKDSVQTYINYFIETYLFNQIEIKGKLNQKIVAKKKFYCSDAGIRNTITGFKDKGSIYENLVFNKIKSKNPSYILEEGIEIDFCYEDTLIEAKYNSELNDKQKQLFEKLDYKNKIIASGVNFFI